MLSVRIKYAMAHLSRKQHTRLLARPNWRRLRRMDMNIMTDPNAISRAALTCKASKRIKIMARPKYVTKKYDFLREPPPYQRIHPRTLAARSNSHIRILAQPKKRVIEYRIPEHPRPPPTDHDWKRHREIIERLARPKVIHKPRHVPKKKWRPVKMRRIQRLAIPVSREVPFAKDPFSVTRSALRYKMTERMRQLVYRKTDLEVVTPRKPGVVSRAALKATGTSYVSYGCYRENVNPGEARCTSRWNGNGSQGGRLHRLPGCFESEMFETIEKARKAKDLQAYEIMIASHIVALFLPSRPLIVS
ncbi:testicular haploid expressed protein-like [Vespula squamosa]|uniref:Testicular haploid expressed protein-like n=1 Tax=Vespula squamosa TaxID=30214 RepID=A0ABD2A1G3_VESSQ